ncbi:MAG: AraC family transcriptional regulator [Sphaerochaetaceae bacterium]|nr:AraC family transcriptional regulator [Sphaerochaetaceae bacterium]
MDSSKKSEPSYSKEKINSLYLHINLKGKIKHKSLVCDYYGKSNCGHTSIDIINHYEGIHNIDAEKIKQSISIGINKEYLYTLLPQNNLSYKVLNFFQNDKSGKTLSNKKTNFKTKTLAKEIFTSPYENKLDKLYLEAKSLELIHTEFSSLFSEQEDNPNIIKLSNQDKEAIYYAKEILLQNLSNPPSIKELARMVAINELKLKVGFNRLFNQTPYSVSLEYRLQEAKKLLSQTNDYNISEIAKLVGYKYPSNFTQAFYKRFGIRPKDVREEKKSY